MSDIRLLNGSLREGENGEITALGTLDFEGIAALRTDKYQREVLAGSNAGALLKQLETGGDFDPIILGMRSQRFDTDKGGMVLHGEVYIIDGLQRVSATRQFVKAHPDKAGLAKMDAKIFFDTSYEIEKQKFHEYNLRRTTVSPNVILRNCAIGAKVGGPEYPALATLYGLSHSAESPLRNRVQWTQTPGDGTIITAGTITRAMLELHQHVDAPSERTTAGTRGVERLIYPLEGRVGVVKLANFRKSAMEFFGLIDEHWGIQHVEHSDSRPALRNNFLLPLAGVLSDHEDFWQDNGRLLAIPANLRAKIGSFPLAKADNMIRQSAKGAGATSRDWMSELLLRHINKGCPRKLVRREG